MLTEEQRLEAIKILLQAAKNVEQVERLSVTFPEIEIEDAYAISQGVAQSRIDAGDVLVGHKVGLTSKAMQRSSKIDEPDFGHIFQDMVMQSGVALNRNNFCIPRVEPELTFVLRDRLEGPNIGLIDVMNATDYVLPSIEIIDARVNEPRKIFDTVSDNGAAAAHILGGRPVRPDEVDLRWVGAMLYRNNDIEETGIAGGVLGHPAMGVAWLANKLSTFGIALEPGHMILSGSFTRPVWAEKGDTLHADFGTLGTVVVTLK